MPFTTKTANYTINPATDFVVFCNATGVALGVTITLPSAALNPGRIFTVKRINDSSGGTPNERCFVGPVGTPTGTTTVTLDAPGASLTNINSGMTLVSDGAKWWVVSAGP